MKFSGVNILFNRAAILSVLVVCGTSSAAWALSTFEADCPYQSVGVKKGKPIMRWKCPWYSYETRNSAIQAWERESKAEQKRTDIALANIKKNNELDAAQKGQGGSPAPAGATPAGAGATAAAATPNPSPSYTAVFTGKNWAIKRADGTYDANTQNGQLNKNDNYHVENYRNNKDTDCAWSSGLDGKEFGCKETRNNLKSGKTAAAVTQSLGGAALMITGQQAQMDAMQKGTASSTYEAAAKTAHNSANMEMVATLVNAYQGWRAGSAEEKHENNASALLTVGSSELENSGLPDDLDSSGQEKGEYGYFKFAEKSAEKKEGVPPKSTDKAIMAGDAPTAAATAEETTPAPTPNESQKEDQDYLRKVNAAKAGMLDKYHVNDVAELTTFTASENASLNDAYRKVREGEAKQKQNLVKGNISRIADEGAREQSAMASEANAHKLEFYSAAAMSALQSYAHNEIAKANEDIAGKLGNTNGGSIPGFTGPQADAMAPRTPTTISGSGGSGENQAITATDEMLNDQNGLGDPLPIPGPDNGLKGAAPDAPKFVAGSSPGGGSAGGGGLGSGSTQAAEAKSEGAAASMASNRDNPRYDSSGGNYRSGGGGGRGGDKGPDLSGLLAQFLPKGGEEDKGGKNGILDFGGRSPASDGDYSLLDRQANLFDRIHQAYQDKQRKRVVGTN